LFGTEHIRLIWRMNTRRSALRILTADSDHYLPSTEYCKVGLAPNLSAFIQFTRERSHVVVDRHGVGFC
jgi:hypothetical protein